MFNACSGFPKVPQMLSRAFLRCLTITADGPCSHGWSGLFGASRSARSPRLPRPSLFFTPWSRRRRPGRPPIWDPGGCCARDMNAHVCEHAVLALHAVVCSHAWSHAVARSRHVVARSARAHISVCRRCCSSDERRATLRVREK